MAFINYVDKTGFAFFYRQIKQKLPTLSSRIIDISDESSIPLLLASAQVTYYIDSSDTNIPSSNNSCINIPATGLTGTDLFVVVKCVELSNGKIINEITLFDDGSIFIGKVTTVNNTDTVSGWTQVKTDNIPTAVSDLTNDLGFLTATDVSTSYYNKTEVTNLIAAAEARNLKISVVSQLPQLSSASPNILYMVPASTTGTNNIFEEYVLKIDEEEVPPEQEGEDPTTQEVRSWEMIGSSSVDLSGYLTFQELTEQQYGQLSTSEKNNGKAYFITDGSPDPNTTYIFGQEITQEDYDDLSVAEQTDGTTFFITDADSDDVYAQIAGYEISAQDYEALSSTDKNNGYLYLISDNRIDNFVDICDIIDVMVHKGETTSALLPVSGTINDYYYLTDLHVGKYYNGSGWQTVR